MDQAFSGGTKLQAGSFNALRFLTKCQMRRGDSVRDRRKCTDLKRQQIGKERAENIPIFFCGWIKRRGAPDRREDPMKQLNRFGSHFGRHERNFTEAKIMKFVEPRDPDAMNPVPVELNFFMNTSLVEVVATGEPARQCLLGKGASA